MAQSLFRIVFELVKQAVNFLIAHCFQVAGQALEFCGCPILEVIHPRPSCPCMRQAPQEGVKPLRQTAIHPAQPHGGPATPRFIRHRGQFLEGIDTYLLRRIAKYFFDGKRNKQLYRTQPLVDLNPCFGEVPILNSRWRLAQQICESQHVFCLETYQSDAGMKNLHHIRQFQFTRLNRRPELCIRRQIQFGRHRAEGEGSGHAGWLRANRRNHQEARCTTVVQ